MPGKRKNSKAKSEASKKTKPNDKKPTKKIAEVVEVPERIVELGSESLKSVGKPSYKLLSWNVNGLRAWVKNGHGLRFLNDHSKELDVICLQEVKCPGDKIPAEIVELANAHGYRCYFLVGNREGYSGVATLTRIKPESVENGVGMDSEGRVLILRFKHFTLINAYVPNSGIGLTRLAYRQQWNKAFLDKVNTEKSPLIICGDLNVAHKAIDLKNPKSNERTAGFTIEERNDFSHLLDSCELTDTFRALYPDKEGAYTFWSYKRQSRKNNVGWRLDYFLINSRDPPLTLLDSVIHSSVLGSDHCPIELQVSTAAK